MKLSGAAADDASLGGDTNIHSAGTGITVKATRAAGAFSRSDGGAGGILGSGALMKSVTAVTGVVKAFIDDAATVGTSLGKPSSVTVWAKDYATSAATATVGSGAIGFTAAASHSEPTASPTVDAHIGPNGKRMTTRFATPNPRGTGL